jgi:hypothetical protein
MRIAPGKRSFVKVEPLNAMELPGIEFHGYSAVRSNHVPERNVRMPCGDSHCLGRSQHEWRIERIDEIEPEFLSQLARRRVSRMFARLDVASRRQPESSILVIDQQHMLAIHNDKV